MNQFKLMKAVLPLISFALCLVLLITSAPTVTAQTPPGILWGWGWNYFGQLGNGTTTEWIYEPVQVSNLTAVVAVSGGYGHSIAVDSNGTAWAWGYNFNGELGNGTRANSSVPIPVSNLTGVVAVAAGEFHSLAVDSSGTAWAWGYNDFGQLGNDTMIYSLVPVQVSNLTGVVAVAAGDRYSLALDSNGTAWAWGDNVFGQLGNGTTTKTSVPVPVSNLTGVVAVAGGFRHSLALDSNGIAWAWGMNDYGQLGNGTTDSWVPVQVSNLTGIVAIAAGRFHSLALDLNGNVWAWGWGSLLGNDTTTNSSVPVPVSNLTGVVAIAAGDYHSIAVDSKGNVWAWGVWLGSIPVRVNNLPVDVTTVAASNNYSLVIGQPRCATNTTTTLFAMSIPLGKSVKDKATVINLGECLSQPTGTVTFQVSTDDGESWSDFGSPKVLDRYGDAVSDPYIPTWAGIHYLRAVYGGDDDHGGSQSGNTDEMLTVDKGPTTIKTRLSDRLIQLNGSVRYTITIITNVKEPLSDAGGTWTVEASQNSGFTSGVVVVDSGTVSGPLPFTVTTQPFTPTSTGDWYFRAVYSGDDNYSSSRSGDREEMLKVTR